MQTVKPVYRIGAAGLDPRDWRLIEIVFKHSQYNRFEFVLAPGAEPESIDILIANTNDAEGVRAVSAVRTGTRSIPVIVAVPRGAPGAARHAISIDRLTLQLLPILNRVVELELQRQETVEPAVTIELSRLTVASDQSEALVAVNVDVDVDGDVAEAQTPGKSDSSDQLVLRAAMSVPETLATVASAPPGPSPSTPTTPLPATISPPPSAAPTARPGPRPPAPKLDLPARPVLPVSLKAHPASIGSVAQIGPAASAAPATTATAPVPNSNLFPFPKSHLSPPAPQQLRVLIVDDSPTVRQQLTSAVQRMGLACNVVGSGAEAIQCLEEQFFDLVLLDVVMPDMDGYKLTRLIKRNRQFRQIPVVLLTSKSSAFDLARGALAGCDTYLIKPVTLQALETAVFKQLRKSLAIDDLSAMLRLPLPEVEPAAPNGPASVAGNPSAKLPDDPQFARR